MVTTGKNNIIKIKNNDDDIVSYFLGIDIGVKMASRKTSIKEKYIQFDIPSSRSLLNSI